MLPAAHRLRQRSDFSTTVRRGRRRGTPQLVVHLWLPDQAPDKERSDTVTRHQDPQGRAPYAPPRAGLVVSKAVGGSVVRHRVARRLRHVLRGPVTDLPPGAMLVVRALAPAADASSAELAEALDRALSRLLPGRPAAATP